MTEYTSLDVLADVKTGKSITRVELARGYRDQLVLKLWLMYIDQDTGLLGYKSTKTNGAVGINIPISTDSADKIAEAVTQAAAKVKSLEAPPAPAIDQVQQLAQLLASTPGLLERLNSSFLGQAAVPKNAPKRSKSKQS